MLELGAFLNGKEFFIVMFTTMSSISAQVSATVATVTAVLLISIVAKFTAVLGEFGLSVAIVGASATVLHHFVEAGREEQVEARAGHEQTGENEQGQRAPPVLALPLLEGGFLLSQAFLAEVIGLVIDNSRLGVKRLSGIHGTISGRNLFINLRVVTHLVKVISLLVRRVNLGIDQTAISLHLRDGFAY